MDLHFKYICLFWIFTNSIPVSSALGTRSSTTVDVIENTVEEFTCQSVSPYVIWYKYESGTTYKIKQNITFSTTNDNFRVTTSTLRFVPSRQQNGVRIDCDAETIDSLIVKFRRTLNVLFPPSVDAMNDISMKHGSKLEINCSYTDGNPQNTTVKWSHYASGQTWDGNLLSISSTDRNDAGRYTCTASNTLVMSSGSIYSGNDEKNFNLVVWDKPDTPTELHIVEDRTTSTSIHLEWKPGFNGGSQQTFHIRCTKSSTDTWNFINITDTGDDIMSHTITGLTEETQYKIVMYASNMHGQSAESYAFISLSKEHKESSAMIGYYVGAALGCFILILLSVILVWRFRSKRADTDTQAMSSSNAPVQNVSPSEVVHYDETSYVPVQNISLSEDVYYSEASGPSYEILDKESRDASNYSSLDTSAQHQKEIAYENMKLKTF